MELQEIGDKERQEDLLEQIISWNADGIFDFETLYEQKKIAKSSIAVTVTSLREQGFLDGEERSLRLTPYGRQRAEIIQNRHQYLTAFIQMICDVGEDTAEKNACRLEHIISEDVFLGICEYMLHGYESIRKVHVQDLRFFYRPGEYFFPASVYEVEDRYPRILCPENSAIRQELLAVIGDTSCFYLIVEKTFSWKSVWYMRDKTWVMAKRDGNRFQLPGDIFTYFAHHTIHMAEGNAYISFTDGEVPAASEIRELNIRLITGGGRE